MRQRIVRACVRASQRGYVRTCDLASVSAWMPASVRSTCVRVYVVACVDASLRACVRASVDACVRASVRECEHRCVCGCFCGRMRARVRPWGLGYVRAIERAGMRSSQRTCVDT